MRLSSNIIKIRNENNWLLYNTITQELIAIDDLENPSKEEKKYLIDNGYITMNDDVDYIDYKTFLDHIRYSEEIIEFIIHTNYSCNINCSYCYQSDIKSNLKMGDETIINLVNYINNIIIDKNPREVGLCFIGGEPLLEWNTITKIINSIKAPTSTYISKSIITNGILLNDLIVNELINYDFKMIQITLDGYKDNHNLFRTNIKNEGSYDIIMSQLKKYSKKIPIVLNINLNSKNINDVKKIFSDIRKNDIKITPIFSEIFDSENNHYEDKISLESNSWYEAHKIALDYGYRFEPFYRNNYFACGLYRDNEYIISPDGKVYKCISGIGKNNYFVGD